MLKVKRPSSSPINTVVSKIFLKILIKSYFNISIILLSSFNNRSMTCWENRFLFHQQKGRRGLRASTAHNGWMTVSYGLVDIFCRSCDCSVMSLLARNNSNRSVGPTPFSFFPPPRFCFGSWCFSIDRWRVETKRSWWPRSSRGLRWNARGIRPARLKNARAIRWTGAPLTSPSPEDFQRTFTAKRPLASHIRRLH